MTRNGRGRGPEPDEHLFTVPDDVGQGEADQAADRLGVEEQQDRGDAGVGRAGLVDEDLAEEGEP